MRIHSFTSATTLLLATSVVAHPFFILNTSISPTSHSSVTIPKPSVARGQPIIHPKRQGLLDPLISAVNSAFGVTTSSSTARKSSQTPSATSIRTIPAATTASSSTSSGVQLPPPVTTSSPTPTSSARSGRLVSTSTSTDDSDDDSSTSTTESSTSSTIDSSTSSTIITTSSTSTTSATPTTTAAPASTTTASGISPTTSSAPAQSDNSNKVPSAGIAVAVILILAILATSVFLFFKYNDRGRSWWTARQERQRNERSFRDALDGPYGGSKATLRQEALGGTATTSSSKRSTMFSFLAPSTVKLGNGQEIRRKPVNWGAPPTPTIPSAYAKRSLDEEKMSIASSAAPIAGAQPEVVELATTMPTKKNARKSHVDVFEMPVHEEVVRPPMPSPKIASPSLRSNPISEVSGDSLPHRATSKASMLSNLRPVSPMTLRSNSTRTREDATPISPISTPSMPAINEMAGAGAKDLPPVPGVMTAQRAQRGSDGVFRLN